jgi:hypothetical protein
LQFCKGRSSNDGRDRISALRAANTDRTTLRPGWPEDAEEVGRIAGVGPVTVDPEAQD